MRALHLKWLERSLFGAGFRGRTPPSLASCRPPRPEPLNRRSRSANADWLKRLTEVGLLERYPDREPGRRARHEYVLTPAGGALQPALVVLTQWGDAHPGGAHPGPSAARSAIAGPREIGQTLSHDRLSRHAARAPPRLAPSSGSHRQGICLVGRIQFRHAGHEGHPPGRLGAG